LLAGRYAPGERIDPATLGRSFKSSPTPVRFALYRLVGEGTIADHAREGFHVPLLTEVALRDLYDWMQRLLVMACSMRVDSASKGADVSIALKRDGDLVLATRELFEAIAAATDRASLSQAVYQANNRLGPARKAELELIPDVSDELANLTEHWAARDLKALKRGLIHYHERRKRRVPRIAALLTSTTPYGPD
jgi:DNA-binding GntR family transcriptional regulator